MKNGCDATQEEYEESQAALHAFQQEHAETDDKPADLPKSDAPKQMRILVVEPTKDPYVKEIDGSLTSMQAIVGGFIQAVEPFDDPNVLLLCNEEAKLLGLPENRFLRNRNGIPYDIIVFNSVNADTGIKYHSTLQNYYQQIRRISDRLCAENGLSVILQGERTKTVSYIEWLCQSKGQPTFRSMLEADLRDAIADANDLGHFFLLMEHKGYEIHHGNRLGFRLRGQERYMYPERKNAAFSEENIERAIAGNLAEIEAGTRPAFLPRPKPQPYRPHPKYKGFLALYYHYCYLLGRIEKRQYPPRMTPHLRREIMKAKTYKARLKFLQENGIATADDLTACMQQAENKVTQLAKQRTILNVRKKKRKKLFDALAAEESLAASKALYEEGISGMESEYEQYAEAKAVLDACGFSRQTLTEEKADIYEQLAQLNKQIHAERQKIKLCRAIADSAAVMQRDVAAQEKSLHEKETEHSFTNRR